MIDIYELLDLAESKGASDLHISGSGPPMLRIHGSLEPIADIAEGLYDGLSYASFLKLVTPEQKEQFHRNLELDFARSLRTGTRIRCNASQERGKISLAIRLLSSTIPTLDELALPQVCKDLILRPRGLVVISGPTGSGKSTTMAAMIQHLNTVERRRVVTIEDPIEYVHKSIKCVITQRELGNDTLSFAEALRHILRQDPDVILVGEMRDTETAAATLTIAETGHLILATGHAVSASQAVERIMDLFPPHERHLAQARLASLLIGVIGQSLVPKASGSGRVAAVEVMLANPAVRNLIREGKIYQLPNVIRTNTQEGMTTLDQSLLSLYHNGTISRESLFAFCNDHVEVEKLIGAIR
ncbi:type IV pilus twitching motility protein PilT [Chloroflexota bacterium]